MLSTITVIFIKLYVEAQGIYKHSYLINDYKDEILIIIEYFDMVTIISITSNPVFFKKNLKYINIWGQVMAHIL